MSANNVCFVSLSALGYFLPEQTTSRGGAERQIYLLLQELRNTHEVSVVVGDFGQAERLSINDITLHRAYTPSRGTSLSTEIQQLAKLYSAMRAADADLYIYRGHPRKAGIVYALSRALGAKYMYHIASDNNVTTHRERLTPIFRKLYDLSIRDAAAVIAQTEKQRELVSQRYDRTLEVIPNGYPPLGNESDTKAEYFLWVGRLEQSQKRPHLFLDLAEQLPEVPFKLVGPGGPDESYNQSIITRAANLPNVDYLGVVDPNEIHDYFRKAIALVNTSSFEGFPNTFLEAWRQGTPVLSLNIDLYRYMDTTSTLPYAEGEFGQFIRLAERLQTDREFRRNCGTLAKKYFENNLTISVLGQNYKRVINEIVN